MDKETILKYAMNTKDNTKLDDLISKDISSEEKNLIFDEKANVVKNERRKINLSNCYYYNEYYDDKGSNYYYHQKKNYSTNKTFKRGFYAKKPNEVVSAITLSIENIKKEEKAKDFIECKINLIEDLFNQIKYDINKPFWYISQDGKIGQGAYTTKEIIEKYNKKEINGNNYIRPLDLFSSKKGNNYIQLKSINDINFFNTSYEMNKEYSTIGKDILDSKKLIVKKEEPKPKPVIVEVPKKVIEIKKDMIVSIKNEENEKKEEQSIVIGKNKKKKKMIDIDVQTGFYTYTKQEQSFIPMYVAGSKK